ncbi:MAG: DUF3800 domain-containing protein, partial [Methylacidiphilaceae bacterium]|nr:DUF3800 domain-containing protein [Candidatus Methylacidiphilaceae bacterium]
MKVLFLDESGDHNLAVTDPPYPVFVLGGVLMERAYAEGPLVEAVDAFKQNLFARTDIILHTADITRNRNGFERLKEPVFRARFYERLHDLDRALDLAWLISQASGHALLGGERHRKARARSHSTAKISKSRWATTSRHFSPIA